MLLLWSRLAAFALMASLTTCSPLPVSPFKVVDTASSLEHAPGPEQVTNFQQRDSSVPSSLNITPPSILTSEISNDIPALKITPGSYQAGKQVVITWQPTTRIRFADIWGVHHKPHEGTASIDLTSGHYKLVLPKWNALGGEDAAYVRVAFLFGVTTYKYGEHRVFGQKSAYVTVNNPK